MEKTQRAMAVKKLETELKEEKVAEMKRSVQYSHSLAQLELTSTPTADERLPWSEKKLLRSVSDYKTKK